MDKNFVGRYKMHRTKMSRPVLELSNISRTINITNN